MTTIDFDTLNFKALLLFYVNWCRGKIIKKIKNFNAAQKISGIIRKPV